MDLQLIKRYPLTSGTCLAAIAVSLAYWSGGNIDVLTADYHMWSGQFWRPFTTTLPHVNPMHLVFNLYWVWAFGSRIEQAYGSLPTAALFAFFAAGSSLAEYDFGGHGVGLSGVVYGLFGYLWIVSRYDRQFWGIVTDQIVVMFIAWFFLCIVLTYRDIWYIANVAHGGGLLLGLLAGWAVARGYHLKARWLCGAAVAGIFIALVLAGTVARPYVNFTESAGIEFFQLGCNALDARRNAEAVTDFELALQRRGDWQTWFNLGLSYERNDQLEKAADAFQQAYSLSSKEGEARDALVDAKLRLARKAEKAGDHEKAARLCNEVIKISPGNEDARDVLQENDK
jgi:GlpG protein